MRFAIRDLFWVTLVAAMGFGWWLSYRAIDARRLAAVNQANRLWILMDAVQTKEEMEAETGIGIHGLLPQHAHVDWSVLKEVPVGP